MKLKIEKKEVTPEYIRSLECRDILGLATDEEIEVLHAHGIQTFMGKTIEPKRAIGKGRIPEYDRQYEIKRRRWRKKWAKISKDARKNAKEAQTCN